MAAESIVILGMRLSRTYHYDRTSRASASASSRAYPTIEPTAGSIFPVTLEQRSISSMQIPISRHASEAEGVTSSAPRFALRDRGISDSLGICTSPAEKATPYGQLATIRIERQSTNMWRRERAGGHFIAVRRVSSLSPRKLTDGRPMAEVRNRRRAAYGRW